MKTKKLYRFSLIELLIVVAIISILAALLLPALNKAREKAQSAFCIGNIKQIATAQLSYANDYEDNLVFHAVIGEYQYSYAGVLMELKYVPSKEMILGGYPGLYSPLFICPKQKNVPSPETGGKIKFRVYGMAHWYEDHDYRVACPKKKEALGDFIFYQKPGTYNEIFYKLVKMKRPSGTVMNADSGYMNTHAKYGYPTYAFYPHKVTDSKTGLLLGHDMRANVSFMDGHVANQSAKALTEGTSNIRQFVTPEGLPYPATQYPRRYQ